MIRRELFRQWLREDGTRSMIASMVLVNLFDLAALTIPFINHHLRIEYFLLSLLMATIGGACLSYFVVYHRWLKDRAKQLLSG
jgi:hypothetical protein